MRWFHYEAYKSWQNLWNRADNGESVQLNNISMKMVTNYEHPTNLTTIHTWQFASLSPIVLKQIHYEEITIVKSKLNFDERLFIYWGYLFYHSTKNWKTSEANEYLTWEADVRRTQFPKQLTPKASDEWFHCSAFINLLRFAFCAEVNIIAADNDELPSAHCSDRRYFAYKNHSSFKVSRTMKPN